MAKKNPTLSYFESPRRRTGEATVVGPDPVEIPANRIPVYRLGFTPHEVLADWASFARTVRDSSLPSAAFFLDSSFLGRREIPREVWDQLLSRQIVITPLVWQELEDWLNAPFANAWFRDLLVEARANGHPSILFLNTSDWPEDIRRSAQYYMELLLTRKLIGHAEVAEFREKHGRDPEVEELTRILQSKVRDRGLVLAKKGLDDISKENFAADEQLTVCAAFYALMTGRETTVLTSDSDLLEQFYKVWFLIDTHYRSMLAAENFCSTPQNLLSQALPHEGLVHLSFQKEGAEALQLPRHFVEWVLPESSATVNAHCLRFTWDGAQMKIASLNFCAETHMSRLLELKGRSGGRNTESLGNRDLHLMVSPPFPEGLGGNAIVGEDRIVPFGHSAFPMIDLNYALMEVERFVHLKVVDEATEETNYVGLNLAAFRATERLLFTKPPEWMDIAVGDMATAIRYFDPATMFFADLDFLRSPHAAVYGDTLVARGISTTTHVRDVLKGGTTLCDAILNCDKCVHLYDPAAPMAYRWGYGHYLGALAFRKLYWQVVKSQVARDHGRDSPDDEWPQIVEHYAGLRGRRLAEEGWRRRDDPTLFFGEELLVQGMLSGMFNGADIVLLTSDPLFLDQFLKLGRLMREHYLACEFGVAYAQERAQFNAREILRDGNCTVSGILGDRAVCCDLAADWEVIVLPQRPFPLNLHCWLFGAQHGEVCRFMPFSLCAERPMQRMLQIKGATGGLNSDRLDGRNVHVASQGNGFPASGLIFEEEIHAVGSMNFPADERLDLRVAGMPWADLVAVINNNEQAGTAWLHD